MLGRGFLPGSGPLLFLCLLHRDLAWENALMSEHSDPVPGVGGSQGIQRARHQGRRENLTTHQTRTVWQRRADAEEKLARHLQEARRRAGEPSPAAPTGQSSSL
jgi:hypothetical protein